MKPRYNSIFELCDIVRECSFALQCFLCHGHLEKVYENGLLHRIQGAGLEARQQHPIKVCDVDGTVLGDFYADLFVENQLIVELKAAASIAKEHIAQLLGYLRASNHEHGLLINFGAPKLEIRKLVLSETLKG